jgi:hypothetical protein
VTSSEDDFSDSGRRDTITYVVLVCMLILFVFVSVYLRLSVTSHSQLTGIWYNHFGTSTLAFLLYLS